MAPVVTGDVNIDALEDLIRLCVELDRLRRADDADRPDTTPAPDSTAAWAALEQAVIGKAVDLLSGPGGLASFLRRRQLGARLGGPSLPLDIGYAESIPAGIRNAVTLRDRHCRFPGGCNQPASACDVHHVKHKKHGGKTSTTDCVLLCFFHHQIVIHQLGLDPGTQPRRHHHRLEQGQDQGPAQPRPARPSRVRTRHARPRRLPRHQHRGRFRIARYWEHAAAGRTGAVRGLAMVAGDLKRIVQVVRQGMCGRHVPRTATNSTRLLLHPGVPFLLTLPF